MQSVSKSRFVCKYLQDQGHKCIVCRTENKVGANDGSLHKPNLEFLPFPYLAVLVVPAGLLTLQLATSST